MLVSKFGRDLIDDFHNPNSWCFVNNFCWVIVVPGTQGWEDAEETLMKCVDSPGLSTDWCPGFCYNWMKYFWCIAVFFTSGYQKRYNWGGRPGGYNEIWRRLDRASSKDAGRVYERPEVTPQTLTSLETKGQLALCSAFLTLSGLRALGERMQVPS